LIWFIWSRSALGILFADAINGISLGGYPLGFWFAHQGSMYIFIALIFWYAKKMGDIDRNSTFTKTKERDHMDLQTTIYLVVGADLRAVHRHRHLGACRLDQRVLRRRR
jgi:putative solute:sodium symporter small subunit